MAPTGYLATAVAAFFALRAVNAIQPQPVGHFLTSSELENVSSIPCLKTKQRDPSYDCKTGSLVVHAGEFQYLSMGSYPHYEESICNSHGDFFCDPTAALTAAEGKDVVKELAFLRKTNLVTCGHLQNDTVDPRHLQPFYLGVALATGFPMESSDQDSLEQFGRFVEAHWNMDKKFVGSPIPYLHCPNTAMLIILPDRNQAFLSTSSCEFICRTRGGPEVITATRLALSNEGTYAAVMSGIREVYHILQRTPSVNDIPSIQQPRIQLYPEGRVEGGQWFHTVQRIIFGVIVVVLFMALLIGFCILFSIPGFDTRRPKRGEYVEA